MYVKHKSTTERKRVDRVRLAQHQQTANGETKRFHTVLCM